MVEIATVHGRFQPPHLEHREYMLAALNLTKHLIIGITQPNVCDLSECPEDPHRAERSANPLTYDERCQAIKEMLLADGIDESRFSFRQFPIELPDELVKEIPLDAVCLTTIRDQWNVVKIERLRMLGYDVRVLWDRSGQSGIQGTNIRKKIISDDQSWEADVHPAVRVYLEQNGILERIKKICES